MQRHNFTVNVQHVFVHMYVCATYIYAYNFSIASKFAACQAVCLLSVRIVVVTAIVVVTEAGCWLNFRATDCIRTTNFSATVRQCDSATEGRTKEAYT